MIVLFLLFSRQVKSFFLDLGWSGNKLNQGGTFCTHNSLSGHSFHATITTNKSTVTFRRGEVCGAQLNAFYADNLHFSWVLRDKERIFMNLQRFDPGSLKHNTFRWILH